MVQLHPWELLIQHSQKTSFSNHPNVSYGSNHTDSVTHTQKSALLFDNHTACVKTLRKMFWAFEIRLHIIPICFEVLSLDMSFMVVLTLHHWRLYFMNKLKHFSTFGKLQVLGNFQLGWLVSMPSDWCHFIYFIWSCWRDDFFPNHCNKECYKLVLQRRRTNLVFYQRDKCWLLNICQNQIVY